MHHVSRRASGGIGAWIKLRRKPKLKMQFTIMSPDSGPSWTSFGTHDAEPFVGFGRHVLVTE